MDFIKYHLLLYVIEIIVDFYFFFLIGRYYIKLQVLKIQASGNKKLELRVQTSPLDRLHCLKSTMALAASYYLCLTNFTYVLYFPGHSMH